MRAIILAALGVIGSSLVLHGLPNKPVKAFLLEGGTKLTMSRENGALNIGLPAESPDKTTTVVALDVQGAPKIASRPSDTIKEKRIVIAHRGASGYLPEHTLAGKAMAYAMGADYLEQDVVLSKDNVPVVLHDVQLDTISEVAKRFPERKREDGRYYAIDFNLAELKQLQLTERFNPRTGKQNFPGRFPMWQSSFQIVTLEEELQFIQGLNKSTGRNVGIYPEIKSPSWHRKEGRDLSRIVLDMLARYGYKSKSDSVFVQCFDFNELKRIREELGYQGRLILLLGDKLGQDNTDYAYFKTRAGLAEAAKVVDGIGPSISHIATGNTKATITITDLVKDAHALGLAVHPYTARADSLPPYAASLEDVLDVLFRKAGVDGMFTDFPDRVTAFLREEAR